MAASAAPDPREPRVRVSEVFYSLQGESTLAGLPTVFVRLSGCPLRCRYCDTTYAFSGGELRPVSELVEAAAQFGARHVCVTGGEPLAQKGCRTLLTALCDAGYQVSLETSGALDIGGVDRRAICVMDIKTPASGEAARNRWANLTQLPAHGQLKFVICDRADFDWMTARVEEHDLLRWTVLLSPSYGELEPAELAEWILASQQPFRLQLQLHKALWGEVPGR